MLVADLMTSPAVTVPTGLPVKAAARLLREHDVAAAPVLGDDGSLLGIVSEIDLLRGTLVPDPVSHLVPVRDPGPAPAAVDEVMTAQVAVLSVRDDAYDAARRMAETGVRSMPVLDDGHVVGVVSRSDLLRALARPDAEIAAEVERALADYFGDDRSCRVAVDSGVVTVTGDDGDRELDVAALLVHRIAGVVRVRVEPQRS